MFSVMELSAIETAYPFIYRHCRYKDVLMWFRIISNFCWFIARVAFAYDLRDEVYIRQDCVMVPTVAHMWDIPYYPIEEGVTCFR